MFMMAVTFQVTNQDEMLMKILPRSEDDEELHCENVQPDCFLFPEVQQVVVVVSLH